MLADDELDFDDDFGDLGELETGGLTTEELEKELGLDLELDLEPISEESFDKPKKDNSEKETTSKTEDNSKKQDEKPKKEEEENKSEENKSTSKQVESLKKPEGQSTQEEKKPNHQTPAKKFDSSKKPIPNSLDKQYNNNNFNHGNRNFNQMGYYPMQQPMFYPQMQANFMAMNGMFPYQQQQQQQQAFANRNRIYVNPNFKGGNAQTMGQRPPMDMQKTTGEEQKKLLEQKAREELLNKQRMEAAESLRKKLASKKAEGGIKRKLPDASTAESSKRPTIESIQTKPSNGGFSILGAAKARATAPTTQQTQTQTRVRSAVENNIRKLSTPATARITRREEASPMARPSPVQRPSPVVRPSVAIPKVPIVTNGKSNVVLITNLKPDVTYDQIKTIADSESGTNNISHNKEEGSATVTFPTVENAVTFRRKYNRTQMGESHINIAFKK